MNKIIFATGNKDKAAEAQKILEIPLEIVGVELDEVQSMDLEYVARKKAEEAYKILQKPLIVDDVSFEIEAWNGFPGTLVKFLLSSLGNKGLLEIFKNENNRNIKATAAIAYHDGSKVYIFLETIKGTMAKEETGNDGFGFDFFFIPEGQNKTFAQMGREEKNKISHRARAFQSFKKFLNNKNKI